MMRKLTAANFLLNLQAEGRSAFTTKEFLNVLSLSRDATKVALYRLKEKELIVTPVHEFHVIVTPEYRSLGSLPADQMIDGLMAHIKIPYYVGLLSAAEKHGAAHHRPQIFQVMAKRTRRNITCGKVRIEFIQRIDLEKLPIIQKNVKTGTIRISTPELTALDLVGYQKQSAGLEHVLTVLAELSEVLNAQKLLEVAKLCPINWAQRLGVLLSMLQKENLLEDLLPYVRKKARVYVPLATGEANKGKKRDTRWKVMLNVDLELDEI
jgi:predicted transcriptional regulator of viral defense system